MNRKIISIQYDKDIALMREYYENPFKRDAYMRRHLFERIGFWKETDRTKAEALVNKIKDLPCFEFWEDLIAVCRIGHDDLDLVIPLLKNFIAFYHAGKFKPYRADSVDEIPYLTEVIRPLLTRSNLDHHFLVLYEVVQTLPNTKINISFIRQLAMWFEDNRDLYGNQSMQIMASGIRKKIHSNITDPSIEKGLGDYIRKIDDVVFSPEIIEEETRKRSQWRLAVSDLREIPELWDLSKDRSNGIVRIVTDQNNTEYWVWDEVITSVEILSQKLVEKNIADVSNVVSFYSATYHPPMSFYDIARELIELLNPLYHRARECYINENIQSWIDRHAGTVLTRQLAAFQACVTNNRFHNAVMSLGDLKQQLLQHAKETEHSEALDAFLLMRDIDSIAYTTLFPQLSTSIGQEGINDRNVFRALNVLGALIGSIASSGYTMSEQFTACGKLLQEVYHLSQESYLNVRRAFFTVSHFSGSLPMYIKGTFFPVHYQKLDTLEDPIKDMIRGKQSLYFDTLISTLSQYMQISFKYQPKDKTELAPLKRTADSIVAIHDVAAVDTNIINKDILGNKGFGVASFAVLNIPTLPAVVLTSKAWRSYKDHFARLSMPRELKKTIKNSITNLTTATGKKFGSNKKPLLLSVRSSPVASMPGLMSTFLSIGLNDNSFQYLVKKTSPEKAYKRYGDIIRNFMERIYGVPENVFDEIDRDIACMIPKGSRAYLIARTKRYRDLRYCGNKYPQDVYHQLYLAIMSVMNSWENEPSRKYRQLYEIPHNLGTGVVIQQMAFGFLNSRSGVGVINTRDPATGENILRGEFKQQGIGTDIVSGKSRTTTDIYDVDNLLGTEGIVDQLERIKRELETYYGLPQEIEITVEDGRLLVLQTRKAILSDHAKLRSGVEMAEAGIINAEQLAYIIPPFKVENLTLRTLTTHNNPVLTRGVSVTHDIGVGQIVFSTDAAKKLIERGQQPILVKEETNPADTVLMPKLGGILTSRGGTTSHAAINATLNTVPCIVNAPIKIDASSRFFQLAGPTTQQYYDAVVREGEWLTLDGSTGRVYLGKLNVTEVSASSDPRQRESTGKLRSLRRYQRKYFEILRNE